MIILIKFVYQCDLIPESLSILTTKHLKILHFWFLQKNFEVSSITVIKAGIHSVTTKTKSFSIVKGAMAFKKRGKEEYCLTRKFITLIFKVRYSNPKDVSTLLLSNSLQSIDWGHLNTASLKLLKVTCCTNDNGSTIIFHVFRL